MAAYKLITILNAALESSVTSASGTVRADFVITVRDLRV